MKTLIGLRVGVLVMDGFEETELTEPVSALQEAGAKVDIVSENRGEIQAFRHHDKSIKIPVTKTLKEAQPEDFDALLLPGGGLSCDALRINEKAQFIVQSCDAAGKPIAVICHGPWLLISAGLAKGRTLTSYHTIRDDVKNAGGDWVDREVVDDRNWVSSRSPKDLPIFIEVVLEKFGSQLKSKSAA
jgi:protease I